MGLCTFSASQRSTEGYRVGNWGKPNSEACHHRVLQFQTHTTNKQTKGEHQKSIRGTSKNRYSSSTTEGGFPRTCPVKEKNAGCWFLMIFVSHPKRQLDLRGQNPKVTVFTPLKFNMWINWINGWIVLSVMFRFRAKLWGVQWCNISWLIHRDLWHLPCWIIKIAASL